MQQYFQISKSLQGLQRFVGFNGLLYLCIENLWGCAAVAREFHKLYVAGSNPAPATRILFPKAVLMVFGRFSKIAHSFRIRAHHS